MWRHLIALAVWLAWIGSMVVLGVPWLAGVLSVVGVLIIVSVATGRRMPRRR
jgi:uncharacterized membrane protein AbrB (regulator of aidB expression)